MTSAMLLRAGVGALLALPSPLQCQRAPEPGDTLTLLAAYATALESNPMIAAARNRADAAGAMQRSAALLPDPEVQLGIMNASLPRLRTDMPTSMAPSIQVMQMIPTAGKLRLAGRIASQETDQARAEAAEVAWMVRERVAMAYYDVYSADRQIAVMRESVRLLATYESVARTMYGSGTGRQSDVLRAGVELRRMDAEITRMRTMRAAAVARLNAAMGRAPAAPVGAVKHTLAAGDLPSPDSLRKWAESYRPILEQRRLAADQASTRLELTRREIWPDLSLGVQYGQRRDVEMGIERMGSLMVGFSVPIFARSRQLRMREEAGAMARMAAAELADARLQVDARITELLAEIERTRSLASLYAADVLPLAEAAVRSALAGYQAGAVDFMTLSESQMAVNRYRVELAQLAAGYGTAVAQLESVVGRELELPSRSPEVSP